MYGVEWLDEIYKYIQEDKQEYFMMLSSLFPLGRTPQSKEMARSMNDYAKKVEKNLQALTPWNQRKSKLAHLRKKIKPGTVVVIPDGSDGALMNSLYKDAQILKRK